MTHRIPALVLAATLSLAPAHAAGILEVSSNVPANVYLNGELIGRTPLSASSIPAGSYQVEIEDPASGEVKTFMFQAPRSVNVVRRLDAEFSAQTMVVYRRQHPGHSRRDWGHRRGRGRGHDKHHGRHGRYPYAGEQVVVVEPGYRRSNVERAKIHTRNTLLGLQVVNQLLTGDARDRKRFRNVGLGLMLLNEMR